MASNYKRISRSQVAEDLLASYYLGNDKNVVYVDIGCLWPIQFSNTYFFYERGGQGICIDPNGSVADSYRETRPRDIFVNAAVGHSSQALPYFEFENPVFNTLDPARANEVAASKKGGGRKLVRTRDVPVKPLGEILAAESFLSKHEAIDLMSIDVEGLEMDVLQGIDFSIIKPRVIIVEMLVSAADAGTGPAIQLLGKAGYALVGFTGHDAFFKRSRGA